MKYFKKMLAGIIQENRRFFGTRRFLDYHRLSRKNLKLAPPAEKRTPPEK